MSQLMFDNKFHDRTENEINDLWQRLERTVKDIQFKQHVLSLVKASQSPYNVHLWWEPASYGAVPKNAVEVSKDVYVARAVDQEDLTPGKLVLSYGMAFVPNFGREIGHKNYEVLVSDRHLEWVPWTEGDRLPSGAIQGGRLKCGEPLYIARVNHEGDVTPGKFLLSHPACYISWGGLEHRYNNKVEILTYGSISLD